MVFKQTAIKIRAQEYNNNNIIKVLKSFVAEKHETKNNYFFFYRKVKWSKPACNSYSQERKKNKKKHVQHLITLCSTQPVYKVFSSFLFYFIFFFFFFVYRFMNEFSRCVRTSMYFKRIFCFHYFKIIAFVFFSNFKKKKILNYETILKIFNFQVFKI